MSGKVNHHWSSFFDTISKTYSCNIMPSPTIAIFWYILSCR
uniref:Uncharacterized protein n=1 Tax=Anguilla anguilla TaxID=7936 RepID=A0A0E9PBQ4_ANGAN